jgi:hypothetical protein
MARAVTARIFSSVPLALVLLCLSSLARASDCPEGTVKVGEQRTETATAIIVQPRCQRVPLKAPTATSGNGGRYRPSGNGMIGGTRWITGYNVQSADPALVKRAHEMMAQQMHLAGLQYADGVDFEHYNFVLGIAASTDVMTDLARRVLLDEYSGGGFSADGQALYNSLSGRAFGDLACHSNGAMVCLAALSRGDITAEHVTLFGPQITVDALKGWDRLVREGKVKSVQLIYNSGDPVAPVSMAIGGGMTGAGVGMMALALFKPAVLTEVIREVAPSISTRTLACARGVDLHCHGMDVYHQSLAKAGCRAVSSGRRVPGTALRGGRDTALTEPPPPC